MAERLPNRSMPPGGVISVLLYPDLAAAVAWLCAAFGFVERLHIVGHRTQLLIGEDAAMVAVQGDPSPNPSAEARTHTIMVRVADLDQHYARACRAGARIVQPPQDFPFGERQYTADDLGGHHWTFTQSITDVDPRSWGGLLPALKEQVA